MKKVLAVFICLVFLASPVMAERYTEAEVNQLVSEAQAIYSGALDSAFHPQNIRKIQFPVRGRVELGTPIIIFNSL